MFALILTLQFAAISNPTDVQTYRQRPVAYYVSAHSCAADRQRLSASNAGMYATAPHGMTANKAFECVAWDGSSEKD